MARPLCGSFGLTLGVALALPLSARAQLGNVAYQQAELGVPVATFNETTFSGPPGGSNTVLMLRKYMVVMGSHDSGVADGPLHVFDVSDPRKPALLKRYTSPETAKLRELHAMPVAMIDGHDFLVMPSITGVQFFDFTDPLNPVPSGNLTLEGVNGGDYDNAAWMVSWAWPYVYVGGTGNGIYVVDAHDPAKPKLTTRIQTGELGGFRIGPVYAAGNYLVASGMDGVPTKVSVLDVGAPDAPFLLATGQAPSPMYSSVVIGDRIYGTGEGGQYSFMKWSPDSIDVIGTKLKMGADKGGYCTYQDAFIFCGQSSEGYRKIDVSDETNFHEVALADIPNETGADTDFATVLGNLVYLGNDHGSGAAFMPHQLAPDTKPPKLLGGYPKNGDLHQPLTTRITLFFSDEIALDSITAENLIVRPLDGEAIAGVFSHSSFNAVSFGAKADLLADTTYEVVIVKDGLTDLSQNPIGEETVLRFSTGDAITEPVGGGGSGGMSSGGGAGGGGSSSAGTGGGPGASGSASASGGQPSSAGSSNPGGSAGTITEMKPTGPASDGGGCGCSVPGSSRSRLGLGVAGALVLLFGSRARRVRSAGARRR
jgi:hypothetical protein